MRAAALAVLLVIACAVPSGAGSATVSPSPTGSGPRTPPPAPDHYVLAAGDQIEISVFGEPDLTRTVAIKPDGVIALPLVNQVKASGKTAAQLEAELTRLYSKYLRKPSVSVVVRQFRLQPIYVMGEVSRPGRYDLTDDMTLLDALTLAGGPTDKANLAGLQVGRVENGKNKPMPIKADQLFQGKAEARNLKLQGGDLIYVPARGLNFLEIVERIGFLRALLSW